MRPDKTANLTQVFVRAIPSTVVKTSMEPIHSSGIVQSTFMLYLEAVAAPYRNGSHSCFASSYQSRNHQLEDTALDKRNDSPRSCMKKVPLGTGSPTDFGTWYDPVAECSQPTGISIHRLCLANRNAINDEAITGRCSRSHLLNTELASESNSCVGFPSLANLRLRYERT
jgi:hypothetical protein